MAYYKKRQQKVNGLWYPQSVTVGKPITTKKIVARLVQMSTVSKSDANAVLADLASVMADYMALGHTVKIDGLGTFYYTAVSQKQGVATPEEVSANQITGVRIRFIPETTRSNGNKKVTRSLSDVEIDWQEWKGTDDNLSNDPGNDGTDGDDGESPDPIV